MSDESSSNNFSPSLVQKTLDFVYDTATKDIEDMAVNYITKHEDVEKAISSLINNQIAKASTSGFLTGLGGAITLPVSLPANVASVLIVQTRMIACIAFLRGYDIRSDQVKTFVFVSLTGSAATDIVKGTGIKISTRMASSFIRNKISSEVLKKINQKVGFRLLAKTGTKAPIVFSKAIPIVGGVVGGGLDFFSTKAIASVAKKVFV